MVDNYKFPVVNGAGGSGSSSSGKLEEDPDSLLSLAIARVLDCVSVGEIEGLVNGDQSIFLNGVPAKNPDGTSNFGDKFKYTTVNGTPTQTAMEAFQSAESPYGVGVVVRADGSGIEAAVPTIDANVARVLISTSSLYKTESNGHVTGTSVTLAIDVRTSATGYQEVIRDTISGKTKSKYQRSYSVELTPGIQHFIRVRRITADSTSVAVADTIEFDALFSVVQERFAYPGLALCGLEFDARQFSSVPTRTYHVKGLKVEVPDNYDPITRLYTGNWMGGFKVAWTNNPAWILYALLTNKRYGLGKRIAPSQVNKASLYTIGKYCDEMVPTGFSAGAPRGAKGSISWMVGSLVDKYLNAQEFEPRFTYNGVINTREDAYKQIGYITSVFRGMAYWSNSTVSFTQDSPQSIQYLYTNANVVNGEFIYEGSGRRQRYTAALVAWNDPHNGFKQVIEYVPDPDGIRRYGLNQTEVVRIGCTSKGEAIRHGKWLLETSLNETDIIRWQVGLDSVFVAPGNVAAIADRRKMGARNGGRLLTGTTASSLLLDAPVTLDGAKTYTLLAMLPGGVAQERPLPAGLSGTFTTLVPTTAFSATPQAEAIWVLSCTTLTPKLVRVVAIKELERHIFEITATDHNPSKYGAIEQGLVLDVPHDVGTNINDVPSPINLVAVETSHRPTADQGVSTNVDVSWSMPTGSMARAYEVSYTRNGVRTVLPTVQMMSTSITNLDIGTYTINVVALGYLGNRSLPVGVNVTILGLDQTPVADVQNLHLVRPWTGPAAEFAWDEVPGAKSYEVKYLVAGTVYKTAEQTGTSVTYTASQIRQDKGAPARDIGLSVRAKGYNGTISNIPAALDANNPQMPAPVVSLHQTGQSVQVATNTPTETDWAGMIVWISTTNGFNPLTTTPVYDGPEGTAITGDNIPGTYYIRAAHYDTYGKDALNISGQLQIVILPVTGMTTVTVLPANPAAVGGQYAVFLDVPESTHQRGVWGWDGTTWKYTRDGANLVANSVTAAQMGVGSLGAISAVLGVVTSGNYTLDAASWIRGGQTAYRTGAGLWLGYASGTYKFSLKGTTGAEFFFDGTSITITDSLGNVTLTSGGNINWASIINQPAGIYNSNIGISNGAITGIGTGSGTVVDNNKVVVGGTNLVRNLNVWAPNEGSSVAAQSTLACGYYAAITGSSHGVVVSPAMALRANTDYTVSFWARVPGGTTETLHVDLFPDDLPESAFTIAGGSNQKFSAVWNSGSGNMGSAQLRLFKDPTGAMITIWNVKLEEGNKATDWSPNPEEIKNSNISVSGGSINGIGTGSGTVIDNSFLPFGANLVVNSDFSQNVAPWSVGYNESGSPYYYLGRDYPSSAWVPTGGHDLCIMRNDGGTSVNPSGVIDVVCGTTIPVTEGLRYEVSAMVAALRCTAKIGVYFYDVNGTYVGEFWSNDSWLSGGQDLRNWSNVYGFMYIPAGVRAVRVVLRQNAHDASTSDRSCYSWVTQVFFGRAAANQPGPSVWSKAAPDGAASIGAVGIDNPLTQSNITTYMQGAAITNAQIYDLHASKIQAQTVTTDKLVLRAVSTKAYTHDNYGNMKGYDATRVQSVSGQLTVMVQSNTLYGSYFETNLNGYIIVEIAHPGNDATPTAGSLDISLVAGWSLSAGDTGGLERGWHNQRIYVAKQAAASNQYRFPIVLNFVPQINQNAGTNNVLNVTCGLNTYDLNNTPQAFIRSAYMYMGASVVELKV